MNLEIVFTGDATDILLSIANLLKPHGPKGNLTLSWKG